MGTEWLWQTLRGQRRPYRAHRNRDGLCTIHRDRGIPRGTHGGRDDPGIAQEVTPAKLTRIKVVLKEPTRTEVVSTLLMGTEWPGQAF